MTICDICGKEIISGKTITQEGSFFKTYYFHENCYLKEVEKENKLARDKSGY